MTFRHTVGRAFRNRTLRRWTLPLTLAALTAAAACSTDPGSAGRPSSSPASPAAGGSAQPTTAADPAASSEPGPTPASTGTTPIRVSVGGRAFDAELYDNPTARDLASRLPVTVSMDDLHGLEKTGSLPNALTTDGVPRGSDPEAGEIGYYGPGHDLVLYYGDVGYFPGIVRIGRFHADISDLADAPDGLSVTVERA